jgi:pyruvate dehydrogenase E2 component (dihydrolipoamide acetyltransferase)
VPDIGDFKDVPVIEVLVKPGDTVKPDRSARHARIRQGDDGVPSPLGGVVKEIKVKVGDKVAKGAAILTLEGTERTLRGGARAGQAQRSTGRAPQRRAKPAARQPRYRRCRASASTNRVPLAYAPIGAQARARARRRSRAGEGQRPKGRILQEDVRQFRQGAPPARAPRSSARRRRVGGLDLLPWPKVDFAKFGPVETKPLSRIKKISGANLHRNWVMIPHVTSHDEADITELEAFRVQLNKENEKPASRSRMLAFMIKAASRR